MINEYDFRLSSIDEFNKVRKEDQTKRQKQKSTSRWRTPMFLKKDRMEQAYMKHLERIKKSKQSSHGTSRQMSKKLEESWGDVSNNFLNVSDKGDNIHRDFTSFGSKVASTSSTSKRSSNEVGKAKNRISNEECKDSGSLNKGKIIIVCR